MNDSLFKQLIDIKSRGYVFKDLNKRALVDAMLEAIGHKDSKKRDDLIYPVLEYLLKDGHLSENHLKDILYVLLDSNHLMYDLNNVHAYSVLTRSFSALQIGVLLEVHLQQQLIERPAIEYAFDTFLDYFEKEQVFDGYNKEVGWMHSIAHSADVFKEFMQIPWLGEAKIKLIFEAIGQKMKQSTHCFIFNEDERMAVALKSGIERHILSENYLKEWIDKVATYDKPSTLPEQIYLENNVKNFLRSLYFRLVGCEHYKALTDHIRHYLIPEVS